MSKTDFDATAAKLAKTRLDDDSPPSSSATTPSSAASFSDHNPMSSFSSPDSSRPPSPMLRPLAPPSAGTLSRGLPSKPFGFNALSGASMGFTAMANSAVKKKKILDEQTQTKKTSPKDSPNTSDDEGSNDGHGGMSTDKPRQPPARRTSSAAMAPFITKFEPYEPELVDASNGTRSPARLEKIAIVGSGSWGTALARVAAINAASRDGFDPEVRMWVREREIPGRGKLTDIINETHQHERYLPSVELPDNLVAVPDLEHVVADATLILFVVPHQFLPDVLSVLKKPGLLGKNARAISAIKGVEVQIHPPSESSPTKTADIYTYPGVIEKELHLPCSALGGANIALDVGKGQFCETTIGVPGARDAALWHAVFDGPVFRVHPIEDVAGVSLSGALKNVVALAAGFVDGMGLGGNTKAAILRIGLLEMSTFTLEFFPGSSPLTFSHHSAGMADLITTSFGGRNRKCAEAFIKSMPAYGGEGAGAGADGGEGADGAQGGGAEGAMKGKSFEVLEEELLGGQKLQGTLTAQEVFGFLEARGRLEGYPLFDRVYRICFEGMDPKRLFEDL